ncbi:hypothetical protein HYX04_05960 [Candidatus Woesearchaeota archaeon]|nr:hypothetical protein [Candidatus Woesearchaeota archaeon]
MLNELVAYVRTHADSLKRTLAPNYERSMGSGFYFLGIERADIALTPFAKAIRAAQTPQQLSYALLGYAKSAALEEKRDPYLDDRSGFPSREEVKQMYRRAVELNPTPIILNEAAKTSLMFDEREDCVNFLEKAITDKTDFDILVKVGRLAAALEKHDLVKRVDEELRRRNISVKIYPI